MKRKTAKKFNVNPEDYVVFGINDEKQLIGQEKLSYIHTYYLVKRSNLYVSPQRPKPEFGEECLVKVVVFLFDPSYSSTIGYTAIRMNTLDTYGDVKIRAEKLGQDRGL